MKRICLIVLSFFALLMSGCSNKSELYLTTAEPFTAEQLRNSDLQDIESDSNLENVQVHKKNDNTTAMFLYAAPIEHSHNHIIKDGNGYLAEGSYFNKSFPVELSEVFPIEVSSNMLTLSIQNNKLVQTDKRIFGNPVRKNSDDNWQQILVLDQQKKYVTLRYRFGKVLNSLERICWKTNVTSLCDATFQDAPIYVPYGFNNEQYFFDNNTVCYDFSKFNNVYFDGTNVEQYPANIKIQAFVVDKKKKYTNIANLSIKYYYGEEDCYSFSS